MIYLGDFPIGAQVDHLFNTRGSDTALIAFAGSPACAVYKHGNTAESTLGVTLTPTYDSKAGMHRVIVDMDADGPAVAFYLAGEYSIVMTAGTVDGVAVASNVIARFSVARSSSGGLDAAGTRAALGMSNADLDTQLAAIKTDSGNLITRLTSARAGYLDNISSGTIATQTDINNLNQSASRRMLLTNLQQLERPESGSTTFQIEARTYTADGALVNADTTPTLTATGLTSGSLAANLGTASNPSTGVYRWVYTVANDAVLEQIRFDLSAAIASDTQNLATFAAVCDFVAATFTTADRSNITAIKAQTDTIPASPATSTNISDAQTAILAKLPAALVGGKINASVGAIEDGVITSAKFTLAAITGVATGYLEQGRQVFQRFFFKAAKDGDGTSLKTYAADSATVITTQVCTPNDGDGNETIGKAT